jgi:hypothetical protein
VDCGEGDLMGELVELRPKVILPRATRLAATEVTIEGTRYLRQAWLSEEGDVIAVFDLEVGRIRDAIEFMLEPLGWRSTWLPKRDVAGLP